MRRISKKSLAVVAAATVIVASAGAAYAYWTSGGSGTGTVGTGTSAAITVNQTNTLTDMFPGDTPQDLEGDFTNSTDASVYVASVTVSIDSVVKATGAVAGTCDETNYTLANPESTVGAEVPANGADPVGSWGSTDTPTIQFNDKASVNQDACQGATVNLLYTIA